MQIVAILVVLAAWVIGAIVSLFDGSTLLAVTTPLLTTMLGFLFASKATQNPTTATES